MAFFMDRAKYPLVRTASDRYVRTQENEGYTPQQIHSVFLQHPSASEQIPRWPKTAARNDSRGDFIYLPDSVMLLFCFNRHCRPEPAKRAKDLFCCSKVNKHYSDCMEKNRKIKRAVRANDPARTARIKTGFFPKQMKQQPDSCFPDAWGRILPPAVRDTGRRSPSEQRSVASGSAARRLL